MKQVELIRKNKFLIIALNSESEAFIYLVAFISSTGLDVYSFRKSQIALQKIDETSTSNSSKYIEFIDIFFKNLATKL